MTLELEEIRSFLAQDPPFAELPEDVLSSLPQHLDMIYVRRGTDIVVPGQVNDYLHIIRSGAVDIFDADGGLLDRRDAGATFGYSTLNGPAESAYRMTAVEDSLLLRLPREDFNALAARFPWLDGHFAERSLRVRVAAEQLRDSAASDVMRTRVSTFMNSSPAVAQPNASIREGAAVMEASNHSALLVTVDGQLQGILTDRDLRRIIANGVDADGEIGSVMTRNPRTISADTLAFEAMLIMAELGIHHVPVVEGGVVQGIISTPDIVRLLRFNPIYLTAELGAANTPEEMAEIYASAAEIAVRFIERGASATEVSALLTVAADALARRLLVLAEAKFGAPPVPYCFAVLGSQGRRGMGLASDQDNCLILSNDYRPEHADYFADLAEFVCQGLNTAGQVLCPGEMMASNPAWRMSVDQWIHTFRGWITAPEPDALLHSQTFFDLRGIHGDVSLAAQVHDAAVEIASHAPRCLAHLAALAARREPPLSFFRGLVVDREGSYVNTLDVKKGGIAAIVQLARLYALGGGHTEVGTVARLEAAAGEAVSTPGARELSDAFEFLQFTALKWQAEQLRRGERPSYHIAPKHLTKTERDRLRDSFSTIKNMQSALSTKFPVRSI